MMIEECDEHDADEWEHHPEWPEYEEDQRQIEPLWDDGDGWGEDNSAAGIAQSRPNDPHGAGGQYVVG